MSYEYTCDKCQIVMVERYPWPTDGSKDFCSEKCYEDFYEARAERPSAKGL